MNRFGLGGLRDSRGVCGVTNYQKITRKCIFRHTKKPRLKDSVFLGKLSKRKLHDSAFSDKLLQPKLQDSAFSDKW